MPPQETDERHPPSESRDVCCGIRVLADRLRKFRGLGSATEALRRHGFIDGRYWQRRENKVIGRTADWSRAA
jgi:hypothetical protein